MNKFIEPLVKEITRKRPTDLMKFIYDYASAKINEEKPQHSSESEEEETEFEKEFLKKLEEKKKKKVGKKNSRQGISAEVFGEFNKKEDFVAKIIPKAAEVEEAIRKLMEKSILFTCLNKEEINIVIQAMEEVNTEVGQAIITEGDKGDVLYIVGSGEYDCFKILGGKDTFLKTYLTGDAFGELALMYNAPRAATIVCKTPGKMYSLDRLTFVNIVQEAAIKKRKANLEVLSKV